MSGLADKPASEEVTVLCSNCGRMIEIVDPRAYILAVHLLESCPSTQDLRDQR